MKRLWLGAVALGLAGYWPADLLAAVASTQSVLFVPLGRQFTAGSVIELRNAAGDIILEHAGETAFSRIGFTSPRLELGSAFFVYINGTRVAGTTLRGMITTAR
ncbi:MAG: hypothetical protein FWB78_04335 [Treponema sp.]|nr:hypothetical protein [Treponema sp.]